MIWTKFTVSNTYLGEFLAQLQQEGYSIFIIKGQVSIFIIKGMIIYEFLLVSSCLNVMQILSFKPFKQSRPGVLIYSLMYAVVVLKDKGFNKVMITTLFSVYINTIKTTFLNSFWFLKSFLFVSMLMFNVYPYCLKAL